MGEVIKTFLREASLFLMGLGWLVFYMWGGGD